MRLSPPLRFTALLMCCTPLACATVPPATAVSPAAAQAARADASMQDILDKGPFPGMAVAVARDGKLIYARGFGVADRQSNAPVLADTRFPIGSITKPLTCLSVLQQVDRGRIDLDSPISRYLPDLPAPSRDATARQLLTHSSGIPNYLENKEFPYNKPTGLSRQDMLGFFAAKPLMFAPGTQFSYSNSNTYLLGLLLEAVTGQSYDSYVADHIFRPFGMTNSDFGARADRAKGYLTRGGSVRDGTAYDWLVPFSAGAIVSSAPDLVRFSNGLFGRQTSADVRNLALSGDLLADGTPNAYRKGCLIAGTMQGQRKYSHPGSIYGFSSHIAYYPDSRLTVVVLANGQGENFPAVTVEHRLARIFLGLPEAGAEARPFDPAEAAWIAGPYAITNRRLGFDRLHFVAKDDGLYLSYGGATSGAPLIPLQPLGNGRYASSIDPEQQFRFARGADGAVSLILNYYDADFPMRKAGG
ncbi:beta-lactamase family protein [Sandaracinobacter sp. RS1-74]|uniref:serine hydrolase domain-containing protein n=1 Tax=Sandaracinobacteroides sayramensis TaxID=2913411 RepID=UPI001EDBA3F7|nr:serine hydrolase domain-containing protein [Sandaracinobacteroides sayramensis]MCG2840633.1 beta-lactamase family protein [Sandaracinobacteroides sayramensis]